MMLEGETSTTGYYSYNRVDVASVVGRQWSIASTIIPKSSPEIDSFGRHTYPSLLRCKNDRFVTTQSFALNFLTSDRL